MVGVSQRSLEPESTRPRRRLLSNPPDGSDAPPPRRRRSRRADRPTTEIMVPAKITVTRVAAARTRQLTTNTVRRINAASRADGAGESGLTGLIWTHALNMAGDALIIISLAGTLFFAAPSAEQRGNVALYLLVTVAPFAIVAPVIGPALDRLQRGRRLCIAATMIGRALLAVIMAVNFDNFGLYPAAFGALVLSKAYGVLKGAVVPRVLPSGMTLVTANSRLSVFALLTAGLAGIVGTGVVQVLGFSWELGLTTAVFIAAAAVSMGLPKHVDHSEGELPAAVLAAGRTGSLTASGRRSLGPHVVTALRATAALRGLAGFLTIFMPFLVQGTIGGAEGTLVLVAVVTAAGLGSFIGTTIGSRAQLSNPDILVLVSTGTAAVVCVVAAVTFSTVAVVIVALVAGITNSLGKHGLDAIIQREVPASLRSSAFARSETLLQLTWVFGGAVAILLPLIGWIAFSVAAALLVLAFSLTLVGGRRTRWGTAAPRGNPG